MRAKYILGRTYYCLGELPRALETYYEAADCADTTASDCDFAKLSRIHAQSAKILNLQVQPRSQLKELSLAEQFARKGNDTLQAIECFAQKADAYDFLHYPDSIIYVRTEAARMFSNVGREDRAARTLAGAITSFLDLKQISKARECIYRYESDSKLFDEEGSIAKGREIYYYIKGTFFLAIDAIDSAEFLFRKELRDGKDLNNQIAGCKGLQEVYVHKGIPDSIAKYASLGYQLNDSVYSLAEMQNIQKLQASYNYNHNKQLAEQRKVQAQQAWMLLVIVVFGVVIIVILFSKHYRRLRKVALDYRLKNANITRRLRKMANANPPQLPDYKDWKELRNLVENEIPSFPSLLNTPSYSLTDFEYDICLLIRVNILPREISRLKNCSPSQVTKVRRSLLLRVFKREGSGEEFDDEIGKIGKK